MSDRFESYLRQAAELVRSGDLARAEGFERLARQTLEALSDDIVGVTERLRLGFS